MRPGEHFRIARRAVKDLFSLSRAYFVCLVLNSVIGAALPYVPVWFSAKLIDGLYGGAPVRVLALYVVLTVGIVFLLNILNTYVSSRRSVAGDELYRNVDWKFSEKSMEMCHASIEDPEVTNLKSRIDKESQTGYNLYFLRHGVEEAVHCLTRIVLSLSMALSLFAIPAVPLWMKLGFGAAVCLAIVCGMLVTGKKERLFMDLMESCVDENVQYGKYEKYLKGYGSGKDIRLYGMVEGLLAFSRKNLREGFLKGLKVSVRQKLLESINITMNYGVKFCAYVLLLYAAIAGQITVGSIARYVACVMLLLGAASRLVTSFQQTLVNHKYLKRYFSWLDIPNPMYQGTLTVEKRLDNEYYVEFRDVSFRYPHSEAYALHHVNLKFRVGEKLAVVGKNGSGKTTFIKLLCRLYDPTEGEILLNGVDIRKYDYEEYMSLFSVVFQDFRLFAFGLGQNVAADTAYDRERAMQCLRQAGLGEEFLAALPKGLESCLYRDFDREGVEISGGEAQKIAMARALYKDAPFLVLDEPTAALDPISEYEVYSKFNEIAGEKTAVYISHRLASCRFCDKIAVFEAGRIVQLGGHESLLADREGQYHRLWHAQAQYYQ